jgi:hypothetical protein
MNERADYKTIILYKRSWKRDSFSKRIAVHAAAWHLKWYPDEFLMDERESDVIPSYILRAILVGAGIETAKT